MARFVVLTRMTKDGIAAIRDDPARLTELGASIAEAGGRVVEQHALLGDHDLFTVVDLPDNDVAERLVTEHLGLAKSGQEIFPAIDIALFTRLLGQTTETCGPYRWQVTAPARVVRRCFRRYAYTGEVAKYCRPYTVDGREHLEGLRGPAVFIANHSSHLDAAALYSALPSRYQARVAFGSAADRWFLKGRKGITKQGWWNSLVYNTYPIKRGGGRASLDYADWLVAKGWSMVIFPEGTRSSNGRMARFRVGPALLALGHQIPVVPLYMEGLSAIRPKGTKALVAGPVTVRIGAPLRFDPGTDPKDATKEMYKAVEALRAAVHQHIRLVDLRDPEPALDAVPSLG
ncbi:MAG: GYD domain-containing protein [Acidimicrobiia bacterium]|nr:GYD domain-containing protein [Acidimicrobiia bacterium]